MTRKIFGKRKDKIKILGTAFLLVLVAIVGIEAVKAYYHQNESVSILASMVGDYGSPDGDINIVYYRQNDKNEYDRVYSAPKYGYVFDNSKTNCTITCDFNNASSACNYSYNETTYEVTLTSDKKVTCDFYFNKTMSSDIDVYMYKEDIGGTRDYNSKKYLLIDEVPAFGYQYDSFTCDNGSTVTFNNNRVLVSASQRDKCYVYFNKSVEADIIVNIYLQNAVGSSLYNKSDSIPTGNTYKLSTSQTSSCVDKNNNPVTSDISYDGFVNIDNIDSKRECNVYLDLE